MECYSSVSPPPPEKDVAENSRISTQGLLYRKYTVHNQRINRFGVVVSTVREGGIQRGVLLQLLSTVSEDNT